MRVLGIDPGLAHTGYGVIDHLGQSSRLVAMGEIVTTPDQQLSARLKMIHDGLVEAIGQWKPEVACVESLFFCTNARTAIAVAQARGVCILATANAGIPMAEYTPLQIKQAVAGYGKATKLQVLKMVKALLTLQEMPKSDHMGDALAAALCHAHGHHFDRLVRDAMRRG
jgi:crossover junction endodeoxyribonuclease RuvC